MKKSDVIYLCLLLLIVLCSVACSTTTAQTTAETTIAQTTAKASTPQVSSDPLEKGWLMSEFGYFVPPESERITDDPNELGADPNAYSVKIHDDKYGDLLVNYNKKTGKRSISGIQSDGKTPDAKNVLMRVGSNVTKSTSELLQDLKEGDAIADAWGK